MKRIPAAMAISVGVCAAAVASPPRVDMRTPPGDSELRAAMDAALARTVKIHGASIGREHGYASGVLVSDDGLVVTVLSIFLEAQKPKVVLADGSSHVAKVVARDESRQLALLKIDSRVPAHFDLDGELPDADQPVPGDWLVAVGNPFKVADGSEPLTVAAGVCAGSVRLAGRRRNQAHPYTGRVLLLDMIVSTPGFGGGAVVNADGRLVGIVGEAVISENTHTWLNYAMPISEVAAFLRRHAAQSADADDPTATRPANLASADDANAVDPDRTAPPLELGIRLFDIGGQRQPAYVDRVRPGSPAHAAGLRKDDLILSLNGRNIATCADFRQAVQSLRRDDAVELLVKRKNEVLTIRIPAEKSQ